MESWQDNTGGYLLLQGDCLTLLSELPDASIDALCTDPPFAMAGGISNGSSSQVDTQFFLFWWQAVCQQLQRVLKPTGEGFIWCDWRTAGLLAEGFAPKKQTYDYWQVTQIIHHYRQMPGQGTPFRNSVDLIAYVRGPKSHGSRIPNTTHNFISKYWYYGKHKHHPAEKDVELCQQLLTWCSDPGMVVIDPFMGSGTTGVAAVVLGRRFVGMEKGKEYYVRAEQRLQVAARLQPAAVVSMPIFPARQPSLFDGACLI